MTFQQWLSDFINKKAAKGYHHCEPTFKEVWDASKDEHSPKWISVDDRLPTQSKAYAVKKHDLACPLIRIWIRGQEWADPSASEITYWMELPE